MKRQVFIDINVTGSKVYSGDRLVEIACVEMVSNQPTGRIFHHHVNPQWPVHEAQTEAHGLTDSWLADKPLFIELANQFVDLIYDAEIVCHDLELTRRYIDSELERAGKLYLQDYVVSVSDGQAMARQKFPRWRRDLDCLSRYLYINTTPSNLCVALDRAKFFAEIYSKLVVLADRKEPKYLRDADWQSYMVELCRNQQLNGRVLFTFYVKDNSLEYSDAHFRFEISDEEMMRADATWFRRRIIETVGLLFEDRLKHGKNGTSGGEIFFSKNIVTIDWLAKEKIDLLMA